MNFPKNTAIECSTWKQVKAIKKKFNIKEHEYNTKKHFKELPGKLCLTAYLSGYVLFSKEECKNQHQETIIHANEYLKMNLKELTNNDAVHCPTYKDVLILKGLAYEAGFDTSGSAYFKERWCVYGKGHCIYPTNAEYSDYAHAKENYKIHKLSKFIKMKTPSKENIQKAYDKLVKEDCTIGIETFETLYPDLVKKIKLIWADEAVCNHGIVDDRVAYLGNEGNTIVIHGDYKTSITLDGDGCERIHITKKK